MNIVKVPEGCLAKAADLKLREEVLLYYKLKPVFDHGYFECGLGVRMAATKMCLSERTVSRWITRLINVGFMYNDGSGYGLVKYDRLFELLGYNISKHKKKSRLGSFKIHKIKVESIDEMIVAIAKEEIQLNQSRQEYNALHKSTPTIKPDKTVDVTCNTMSCFTVGRLIGGSRSTGHRIEKRLVSKYKNTVIIDKHVECLGNKDDVGYVKNSYISNGLVFRQLSSRIYIH